MLPLFRRLKEGLKVLPGIGEKSATRMAAQILQLPAEKAEKLVSAIEAARAGIRFCQRCHGYAENELCPICRADDRDGSLLCVVRTPLDVWALEETGRYRGYYHVLGGVLSPIDGIGPEQLHLDSLFERLRAGTVQEVLFALPATPEAEATAHIVMQEAGTDRIRYTHLAYGIPVGGTLEYLDRSTLGFALDNRRNF